MAWDPDDPRRRDLDDEIRAHLEMDRLARIARGESPTEAARAAAREFGDMTTVREVTSDNWRGEWLANLRQDIRHAARRLARVPGFTAVAVITLALGIGANTAIFSVLNGVVLRPLPYPDPSRLMFVTSQFPTQGFSKFWLDAGEVLEYRERNRSFSDMGGYATTAVNVGADGAPVRAPAGRVTAGFFHTLGVAPERGRFFTDDEMLPNAPLTVILSDELWHSAFGGRAVLDSQVTIDGVQRTVVGIMPPGFDIHDQGIRAWVPIPLSLAQVNTYRGGHFLYVVARLKDGVTTDGARAELATMMQTWTQMDGGDPNAPCCGKGFVHTPTPKTHPLQMWDLREEMVGGISRAIWVLQAAVALVLLIACANLANLLLMRAESQRKELAVRAALGAGRGRLLSYFAAESVVLTLAGSALGVLLAWAGLRGLVAAAGSTVPRAAEIALDGNVLAFTLGLAALTGVVFGLVPLLHLNPAGLSGTLRESGTRTTSGTARHRVRRGLVIAEMALAVMLVVGAGLLLRSFWNLTRVDAGFDRANLVTFGVALPTRVYTDSMRRVQFYQDLTSRLGATPGVLSVAAMAGLPPRRQVNANDTQFEGMPQQGPFPFNVDYYQYTTPGYFETMRIPMVSGRGFGAADGPETTPVAIINETLAKRFYPGVDPVGRRIRPGAFTPWYTIVGVAKDVKQGGVESKTGTELYFDAEQMPKTQGFGPSAMNVVVRTTLPVEAIAPSVRRVMGQLDPSLPIIQLRSMDDVFAEAVSRPHFLANLLATFAGIALLLAAVGTYGVLAYSVAERTREIGIRMALGASANGVVTMVLRQGLALAVLGVAAGLVGAWGLTRLAATLLFGVAPSDPVTFVAVGSLMLVVAAVAASVPARRAVAVDPLHALREE